MTDTTKPNNDDKHSAHHEAADNPHGRAMGKPDDTASSRSTSPPLDTTVLRELALNAAPDYGPKVETWAERHRMMGHHPHSAPTTENPERWDCDCGYIWRILTDEQIRMNTTSAEHGWIGDPQPTAEQRKHSVEVWAERHRAEGHHPHPAPTTENPERWDCECGHIWRVLTEEQTRQKWYTMMGAAHLLPTRRTR